MTYESQHMEIIDYEVLKYFMGDRYKQDALLIYQVAMTQIANNPDFILRAKFLRNRLKFGRYRYDNAIRYLKSLGLAETYPVRCKKGQWGESKYMFYTWNDRIKSPSLSDSTGPQKDTKAAAMFKNKSIGENYFPEPPKPPSNRQLTDCSIYRQSDNRTIYLQGGDGEEKEGGGAHGRQKNTMIPFDSSDGDKHTQKFLSFFQGQNTFLTFDDSKKKDRKLTKVYHKNSPLMLAAKNSAGAGIFLTINETDGKGRKKENIIRVRAVFADLDGAPLKPVLDYNPSLVVESSPGRYHAYWLTDDIPLDWFPSLQQSIANLFGGDNIKDLSRVMRIPGYYHCKREPVLSKILYTNSREKYSLVELQEMFPKTSKRINSFSDLSDKPYQVHGVEKGRRNDQLCKIIGAMKKRGDPEHTITEKAYKFGETCSPPLLKRDIDSVLKATNKWN